MKLFKALLTLGVFMLVFSCSNDDQLQPESNLETEKRQWTLTDLTNPITPCEANELTYFIDDCFDGSAFDGAIQAGMDAYSNAPISINWTEVDNAAGAHLVFDCIAGGECGEGIASFPVDLEALHPDIFAPGDVGGPNVQTNFPSGGSIGGEINLNFPWATCSCSAAELDPCFFQALVMHEVSHVLGLVHNDVEEILTNNGLATHVSNTPLGPQENSVINTGGFGVWCDKPCEFNNFDITALQSLYPLEVAVDAPTAICVGEEGEICVSLGDGIGLTTMIVIDGNASEFTGDCFPISFDDPGNHTISVVSCVTDCQEICTETELVVRAYNEDLECYCVCEAQEQSGRKNPIELWEIQVDCCDDRPCSELIPGWWYEYLVDDKECFKKEEEIPCDPPQVSLSGTGKICIGDSGTYCISGVSGPITWNISGMGSITTSGTCLTFTPNQIGDYTISTTVCEDDCCVTESREVEVSGCEVECYCECEDGQSGDIIELIYDCNEVGDCQDIFYEDDIYNCKQLTRIR